MHGVATFYRVIVDCRPSAGDLQSFMTIKFVEATDRETACRVAIERTKILMRDKGFAEELVASFAFVIEEAETFDPVDAEPAVERSFIYYPGD